jgi:hypothetical protein
MLWHLIEKKEEFPQNSSDDVDDEVYGEGKLFSSEQQQKNFS